VIRKKRAMTHLTPFATEMSTGHCWRPRKQAPIITSSRLVADLRGLGVAEGQTVMLHASVKAIGWVVGGPDTVLQALLDVLTPEGTLIMMVSWEDNPYHLPEWTFERQKAYLEECPPFDHATSRANLRYGILTEYFRTRPGALRSNHPENSFAAVGRLARWIIEDHPLNYSHGAGSPLAKLCEAKGKVLLLGAPLDSVTLVHHAESLARVPSKRTARYRMPVSRNGLRVWVDIEEYDTSRRIVDWHGEDYLPVIVRDYLASGKGNSRLVGAAQSHLLDSNELIDFAVAWMERELKPAQ
jgi:aminoglycoside 3-N-acetyltransferase